MTADKNVCPPRTTKTSRGVYTWGSAIGGNTVLQPCRKLKENSSHHYAFALCRENGQWDKEGVNVSHCGYTSMVSCSTTTGLNWGQSLLIPGH